MGAPRVGRVEGRRAAARFDVRHLRRTSDDMVICDDLTLGESFALRFMGLMGRSSLAEGEGLYLPTSSIHMMFMRFAIDALFLSAPAVDGTRQVVGIREHLPPWRGLVLPVRSARAVVELPAGRLAAVGVRIGDEVVIESAPSKRRPVSGA